MRSKAVVSLILLATLGISMLAMACEGVNEEVDVEETPTLGATETEEGDATEEAEEMPPTKSAKTIQLELDDFYFEPKGIELEAGKLINLELTNEGETAHTFTIDELNVDQTVQPEQRIIIPVVSRDKAAFAFYCRFHRNRGMQGIMTVRSPGASDTPAANKSPAPEP